MRPFTTEKLETHSYLKSLLTTLREWQYRIVFTNGCFDILHFGHVRYLEKARQLGDFLIVGLNSDASVRALKGPTRPVNQEGNRAGVLCGLACVDIVVIFTEETPLELIKLVKPNFLVKGDDYARADVVGGDFVESYGGKVELIPLVAGLSTTKTIEKMKEQPGI